MTGKPIRSFTLDEHGNCPCGDCVEDRRRDDERRDAALAAIVYEAGAEQLRLAALEQVPAFLAAFEKAS